MSDKSLTYGEVIQFRCTRDLEEMLQGDMLNDGTLSLSQVAQMRLEVAYGLTGGPDVAHDTKRSTEEPPRGPEAPAVPARATTEKPPPAVREQPTGGITMNTLEIVAHLSRQVLAANCMRVLELREGRLWPLADSGARKEVTERLSGEGLGLDDGVAGQAVSMNRVWFGPIQDSYRGTLEEPWKSVGCAPIVVTQDGASIGPVYGLLFLGYKAGMVPTSTGRINLVAFATALARIWGLDG